METYQTKNQKNCTKPLKMTSIEETIQLARLQQAANSSSLYERKPNQKALKVLTVAAYILFVSMAAIILSFYYVFIWDPTTKTMAPRPTTNCETAKKIVIPESIAIKLANTSEVSAEYFFRDIYRRYQMYQKQERRDRQKLPKRMRVKKPPNTELVSIRDQKIIDSIRSTIPTNEMSSIARSTANPLDSTPSSNSKHSIIEEQSYADDEDLENGLEASGLNRIRNETSNAYNLDDINEADN
ncbi:uncharacterized protein LOC116337369 [Contarinia nasturtii]|uniref:uncharacterized protein LOC116337369 n=1 Tax=Contarinia nasturtii TaxID=265458 RepID=UPI0012D41266|nr:uncharacterized protein LOC116337369 [Contarinia nasturtii]XP_031617714.1 uncharacterized protein LOC116337369 [Contarinia nasturtii]XP_031617715.1 uncharacterized protein LOC116337369 [Contarinia nasturtii]XP_031617716.1 uncharacterized protein LOC116337369 [Contarinia nasturtii]